jgi:hypothetical protein
MSQSHREVGRRIYAAVISCQLGISLANAMKNYVPDELDESWGELGWALQCKLHQAVMDQLTRRLQEDAPPHHKGPGGETGEGGPL